MTSSNCMICLRELTRINAQMIGAGWRCVKHAGAARGDGVFRSLDSLSRIGKVLNISPFLLRKEYHLEEGSEAITLENLNRIEQDVRHNSWSGNTPESSKINASSSEAFLTITRGKQFKIKRKDILTHIHFAYKQGRRLTYKGAVNEIGAFISRNVFSREQKKISERREAENYIIDPKRVSSEDVDQAIYALQMKEPIPDLGVFSKHLYSRSANYREMAVLKLIDLQSKKNLTKADADFYRAVSTQLSRSTFSRLKRLGITTNSPEQIGKSIHKGLIGKDGVRDLVSKDPYLVRRQITSLSRRSSFGVVSEFNEKKAAAMSTEGSTPKKKKSPEPNAPESREDEIARLQLEQVADDAGDCYMTSNQFKNDMNNTDEGINYMKNLSMTGLEDAIVESLDANREKKGA